MGLRLTHIVTAVYGSQSIMPSVLEEARLLGAYVAAIATEYACRLVATFDPSEVRTESHVAVVSTFRGEAYR